VEKDISSTQVVKRKRGDRKDGTIIREVNPLNELAMWIIPLRTQSELCILQEIDVTNLMAYVEERSQIPDNNIGFFNTIMAAFVRLVAERPVLNRFVKNHNFYQRRMIEMGYVAKVNMSDEGIRGLSKVSFGPESTVFDVADAINQDISLVKSNMPTRTNAAVAKIAKYPKFCKHIYFHFAMWMDKHGWVPQSVIQTDPNYSTIFVSNVGSIDVDAPFHHLYNWGTNGIFVCIGQRRKVTVQTENGQEERTVCNFSFTLDERIADGYYYSKSVIRFREILNDPECLEKPYVVDPDRKIVF
jgi:hypothetical protein